MWDVSGRASAAELAGWARDVRGSLDEAAARLPEGGSVSVEECTRLAARLRRLAKDFDRYAGSRHLRVVSESAAAERSASVTRHPSGLIPDEPSATGERKFGSH